MGTHERQSWTGRHYISGRLIKVTAEEGVLTAVEELHEKQADVRASAVGGSSVDLEAVAPELWIAPGLIDLQVNGVQGIDFNEVETNPEQVLLAVRHLQALGVIRFCPTVVTAPPDDMAMCIRTIAEACEMYPEVRHAVLGIHVEGPYISEEDGPRGAHTREAVRDPVWTEFEHWQKLAGGRIRMLTLAPERAGALDFIRLLVQHGVVAAIGHTAATEDELRQAVAAGATMSTHLGNGAHPLLPRHPNYIWSQLANDGLWAGLIGDGHHLPPSTLKAMIRAKAEKAILVSDMNHFAGLPPGRYLKRHRHEVILAADGRLVMADNPLIFSGAATPLNRCVENVARYGICTLGEAIRMASERPAAVLGLSEEGTGTLLPGASADLLLYTVGPGGTFEIQTAIAKGERV
ncbi:N-acetylglucosamine-6-phosphate deacetylase [Paenibacillus koleovorans]|uniref:N-acetylglucosamine-6-phosphate deacetylase n=1 Tax=Paenibacillus koleovorans TaxID=121608 RepID=UPI0013E3978E|nr:amidohydrolase family protein [Paenibacillus koleovorans]